VVEEAIAAGIEDILLIQGRGKTAIEDFFDTSYELEDKLVKSNQIHLLERVQKVRDRANIISIRQKQALGLGHAVLCGKSVIGDNPFALLLGDEIMIEEDAQHKTVTTQLTEMFYEYELSSIAIMKVTDQEVHKYGIANVKHLKTVNQTEHFHVSSLIEKPTKELAPSNWALPGRYVLSSKIFDYLENAKPSVNGEIQLTDSMNLHAQKEGMMASTFSCKRYDAGDKLGYLMANIELGLKNPEFNGLFKEYLKQLTRTL
jgi:UTP--glucose-1-phosphate uridylyltransferase